MFGGGPGAGVPSVRAGWGRAGNCSKTPPAGRGAAPQLVPRISGRPGMACARLGPSTGEQSPSPRSENA
eukprot:2545610-Alexandrium_andersonii.AAC.1